MKQTDCHTSRTDEAEPVDAERRRRAKEEQAGRHARRQRALRCWLWAGGIVAVGVVCVVVWYWGIHVPALERARREQDSRERQAAWQAELARLEVGRKSREALAVASPDHPWVNSLGMKFVPVPGTEVLFCVWETRWQDYAAYLASGKNTYGNHANNAGDIDFHSGEHAPGTYPVAGMYWVEAKAFCDWLTTKERAKGQLGADQSYRLPADWEWSVAVGLKESRDGSPEDKDKKIKDVYPWGTQWPPPPGAGNYWSHLGISAGGIARGDWNVDSYSDASPVGSFAANQYGIYDLGGNVWEWCEDRYYANQQGDPLFYNHAYRGGSYAEGALPSSLWSSARCGDNGSPKSYASDIGFRCVLVAGSLPATAEERAKAEARIRAEAESKAREEAEREAATRAEEAKAKAQAQAELWRESLTIAGISIVVALGAVWCCRKIYKALSKCICKRCGAEYSIWTARLGAGVCNTCCEAERNRRAEEAAKHRDTPAPSSSPPPPKDKMLFYYKVKEEEKGPYTLKQLTSMWDNGQITADALHRTSDSPEWVPLLQRFSEPKPLSDAPIAAGEAAPVVTATPTEQLPQKAESRGEKESASNFKKGCLGCLGIIVLLIIIGAIFSPSHDRTVTLDKTQTSELVKLLGTYEGGRPSSANHGGNDDREVDGGIPPR
jgi:hypothetical protein